MRASTSASAWISRCRQVSARPPSRPFIWRNACRRWPCVSAATRSARPSTAVRSSLPFSKARRVNSPASAGRRPSMRAERGEHRGDHRAAAVQLQLGDVLAGLAMRRGKPQRQRLVDDLAVGGIADARERRLARGGDLAGQGFERLAGARPGNAHDRNRRRPAAGGEGEDGVACWLRHRGAGERRGEGGSRGTSRSDAVLNLPSAKAC